MNNIGLHNWPLIALKTLIFRRQIQQDHPILHLKNHPNRPEPRQGRRNLLHLQHQPLRLQLWRLQYQQLHPLPLRRLQHQRSHPLPAYGLLTPDIILVHQHCVA